MTENNKKVNDLSFFMPDKQKESAPEEVYVSKRFIDDKGSPIPFKMKSITVEKMEQLEKDSTTRKKVKGQGMVKDFDSKAFYEKVALHSTIYPDFTSKELLDAYGEVNPASLVKTILHVPGEYANWINKALEVNELDEDFEDVEDDIKN